MSKVAYAIPQLSAISPSSMNKLLVRPLLSDTLHARLSSVNANEKDSTQAR